MKKEMQAAFTLSQACVCFDDGDHLEESKVMMTMTMMMIMMMMVTWRYVGRGYHGSDG